MYMYILKTSKEVATKIHVGTSAKNESSKSSLQDTIQNKR